MTGAPTQRAGSGVRSTSSGAGRALVAVYGIFALAATARAGVQLLTKFEQAPLAYLLSALAAVIYIVATITLARGTRASRRLALIAIIIELVGVLSVGTLSLLYPEAFPRATVWTAYGIGYGFVPLVLPILGLAWLWHTRRPDSPSSLSDKIVRREDP
jgi:cytochrome bd-type quinol oxidase subunit 2